MVRATSRIRAFTLVEVLVVISILAILISMVIYVSGGVSGTEQLLRSQNHMREINQWMQAYSNSRDDRVVPSQFDRFDEDGQGEEIGGVASRMAYDLQGSGNLARAQWIACNNRYVSQSDPVLDLVSRGTWADAIWVDNGLDKRLGAPDVSLSPGGVQTPGWTGGSNTYRSYKYSAPDREYYETYPRWDENPLRSVAPNSHNYPRWDSTGNEVFYDPASVGTSSGSSDPLGIHAPMGNGAWDKNMPGYFAANNFFDTRSESDITGDSSKSSLDREWTTGQVRAPARSMYLVDSFAGESIGGTMPFDGSSNFSNQSQDYYLDTIDAFAVPADLTYGENKQIISGPSTGLCTQEVDFRYSGGEDCLMLMLDGHIRQEARWGSIWDLESRNGNPGRGIRILELDKRKASPIMTP
jgi:prepilin-type N-terminal cleavage/methylation domain-containing protein